MSGTHVCTFLLIALSCYALAQTKTLRVEQQQQQEAMKKLDVRNPISLASYTPEQKNSHIQSTQAANFIEARDEKRPKRSQQDMTEYKDLNDIIDEIEENTLMQAASAAAAAPLTTTKAVQEYDFENMPPLTYYLLLQKLKQLQAGLPPYRVRTPRLGRSIDFQQLMDLPNGIGSNEEIGGSRQFVSRLIKKSVPFKPRLGKRAQMLCDRND